jgi:hypothetical protein
MGRFEHEVTDTQSRGTSMARKMKDESQDLAERRGFNGNGATIDLVLINAPLEPVASAVKEHAKCTTWRKDVYGKSVKATKQSYMVYRLAGHGWTLLQSVCGTPADFQLAQELSRRRKGRAMWLRLSEVASWMGYYLFDGGAMTEILEDFAEHHGDASHLPRDVVGSLKVHSTGRGIFGSSTRKVALSKLKTPIDAQQFVDSFFRSENILAPVSGEWGSPGTVTLEFPDIGADDMERLDFLGGGAAAPAAAQEEDPELIRLRALVQKRKAGLGVRHLAR